MKQLYILILGVSVAFSASASEKLKQSLSTFSQALRNLSAQLQSTRRPFVPNAPIFLPPQKNTESPAPTWVPLTPTPAQKMDDKLFNQLIAQIEEITNNLYEAIRNPNLVDTFDNRVITIRRSYLTSLQKAMLKSDQDDKYKGSLFIAITEYEKARNIAKTLIAIKIFLATIQTKEKPARTLVRIREKLTELKSVDYPHWVKRAVEEIEKEVAMASNTLSRQTIVRSPEPIRPQPIASPEPTGTKNIATQSQQPRIISSPTPIPSTSITSPEPIKPQPKQETIISSPTPIPQKQSSAIPVPIQSFTTAQQTPTSGQQTAQKTPSEKPAVNQGQPAPAPTQPIKISSPTPIPQQQSSATPARTQTTQTTTSENVSQVPVPPKEEAKSFFSKITNKFTRQPNLRPIPKKQKGIRKEKTETEEIPPKQGEPTIQGSSTQSDENLPQQELVEESELLTIITTVKNYTPSQGSSSDTTSAIEKFAKILSDNNESIIKNLTAIKDKNIQTNYPEKLLQIILDQLKNIPVGDNRNNEVKSINSIQKIAVAIAEQGGYSKKEKSIFSNFFTPRKNNIAELVKNINTRVLERTTEVFKKNPTTSSSTAPASAGTTPNTGTSLMTPALPGASESSLPAPVSLSPISTPHSAATPPVIGMVPAASGSGSPSILTTPGTPSTPTSSTTAPAAAGTTPKTVTSSATPALPGASGSSSSATTSSSSTSATPIDPTKVTGASGSGPSDTSPAPIPTQTTALPGVGGVDTKVESKRTPANPSGSSTIPTPPAPATTKLIEPKEEESTSESAPAAAGTTPKTVTSSATPALPGASGAAPAPTRAIDTSATTALPGAGETVQSKSPAVGIAIAPITSSAPIDPTTAPAAATTSTKLIESKEKESTQEQEKTMGEVLTELTASVIKTVTGKQPFSTTNQKKQTISSAPAPARTTPKTGTSSATPTAALPEASGGSSSDTSRSPIPATTTALPRARKGSSSATTSSSSTPTSSLSEGAEKQNTMRYITDIKTEINNILELSEALSKDTLDAGGKKIGHGDLLDALLRIVALIQEKDSKTKPLSLNNENKMALGRWIGLIQYICEEVNILDLNNKEIITAVINNARIDFNKLNKTIIAFEKALSSNLPATIAAPTYDDRIAQLKNKIYDATVALRTQATNTTPLARTIKPFANTIKAAALDISNFKGEKGTETLLQQIANFAEKISNMNSPINKTNLTANVNGIIVNQDKFISSSQSQIEMIGIPGPSTGSSSSAATGASGSSSSATTSSSSTPTSSAAMEKNKPDFVEKSDKGKEKVPEEEEEGLEAKNIKIEQVLEESKNNARTLIENYEKYEKEINASKSLKGIAHDGSVGFLKTNIWGMQSNFINNMGTIDTTIQLADIAKMTGKNDRIVAGYQEIEQHLKELKTITINEVKVEDIEKIANLMKQISDTAASYIEDESKKTGFNKEGFIKELTKKLEKTAPKAT